MNAKTYYQNASFVDYQSAVVEAEKRNKTEKSS